MIFLTTGTCRPDTDVIKLSLKMSILCFFATVNVSWKLLLIFKEKSENVTIFFCL